MDNDIVISVLVLTYFHEKFVRRALDTILSQKCQVPFEIQIADDCSEDGTIEILQEYQKKYPDKVFVHVNKENIGICRNEYNALLRCRGKYIVRSAGDDWWTDNYMLQKQYDFLENNCEFIAECNITEGFYTNGESSGDIYPPSQYWNKEYCVENLLNAEFVSDGAMMMRNIFKTDLGKKEFAMMHRFSREIDDLPFWFFTFDFGRIHISDNVCYAQTKRREKDYNQHNYNTLYKGAPNVVMHLKLVNRLDKFYKGKYNFRKLYRLWFSHLLYFIATDKNVFLIKNIKYVPIKYWPSCLFYTVREFLRSRIKNRKITIK